MDQEQIKQLLQEDYLKRVEKADPIKQEFFEVPRERYTLEYSVSEIPTGSLFRVVILFTKISQLDKEALAERFRELILKTKPKNASYFQGESLVHSGQWEVSLDSIPALKVDSFIQTFHSTIEGALSD